ncbi:MAG TPA: hypothetical protein VEJ63_16045 [Planctomycetota bacterium]|nr:hypothetical protein [Planctomycetota bacterium]
MAIVIARSVDLLHQADPTAQSVIREVARYGSERLNFFSGGMTALSIAANLLPYLGPQTAFFTTYKAAKLVAANAFGRAPRMLSEPLDTDEHSSEALLRWLRRWAENGQVTGGERVILTISRTKASTQEISAMFFEAATDRMFASDGQAVYMPNSGFELIEFLGRDTAEHILPLLVRWISNRGAGAEDKNPWNNPVDVIAPLRHAEKQIPAWIEAGKGKTFSGEEQLKTVLLGDDPYAIIEALGGALQEGSTPTNLAKIVAYAAARRLAHFSLKNELQDWSSPARTFSYCNAMHRIIKRSPEDALLVRGIFHGAIAVYMDRFLNVPSAPLPGARQKLDDLPTEADGLCLGLLNALDEQANVEATARYVARYSALGLDMKALFNTLMLATMREDLGLQHWLVLSAGVTQALEWQGRPEAGHILVAVARHLAAFCPTPRSEITAAKVASRLNRGERLYEAQPAH